MKPPWFLLPVVAAACGLCVLQVTAPGYLFHQGFPLDDAWIHAVYARELARSGMLAYNPGVAATGETAPLWAAMLAIIQWTTHDTGTFVLLTKAFGFALHVSAAVVLGLVLVRVSGGRHVEAWASAGLVALHPDLIAASVSGMEVPLATLVIAGVLLATTRNRIWWLAVAGGLAIAARPEVAAIAATFPLAFWLPTQPKRAVVLSAAGVAGALIALALFALRNELVSGMLLPATFYAKVNGGSVLDLRSQVAGFYALLGRLPLLSPLMLVVGLALSVWHGFRTRLRESAFRVAPAMFLTGLLFCTVSFALIPPVDPAAFYHQRYLLPALPLLVGALPLFVAGVIPSRSRRVAATGACMITIGLAVVLLAASPARAARLSSDARNIDDVQVAIGRSLEDAPASAVFWVVDAGASRYFGRPFVVDLMGLNSPDVLGPGAQAFLNAHEPHVIQLLPGWSSIAGDSSGMPATLFQTTTAYTVTSFPEMGTASLIACIPAGTTGTLAVRARRYTFTCAAPPLQGF